MTLESVLIALIIFQLLLIAGFLISAKGWALLALKFKSVFQSETGSPKKMCLTGARFSLDEDFLSQERSISPLENESPSKRPALVVFKSFFNQLKKLSKSKRKRIFGKRIEITNILTQDNSPATFIGHPSFSASKSDRVSVVSLDEAEPQPTAAVFGNNPQAGCLPRKENSSAVLKCDSPPKQLPASPSIRSLLQKATAPPADSSCRKTQRAQVRSRLALRLEKKQSLLGQAFERAASTQRTKLLEAKLVRYERLVLKKRLYQNSLSVLALAPVAELPSVEEREPQSSMVLVN